ncbi:PUA domain-containing protein, partial [Burkholderia sp. SIMBA_013]
HWLRHTLVAQGEILVDEGAEKALIENGASLLSSGIVDVQGDFDRGDAVLVRSANDTDAIAKGICQYSAHELMHIKG